MAVALCEALPEHARAVAEWLDEFRGLRVEADRERRQLIVTLHVPAVLDEEQTEVLMIRARCALRRYDPAVTAVEVRVDRS